jgi:hypothetical protein
LGVGLKVQNLWNEKINQSQISNDAIYFHVLLPYCMKKKFLFTYLTFIHLNLDGLRVISFCRRHHCDVSHLSELKFANQPGHELKRKQQLLLAMAQLEYSRPVEWLQLGCSPPRLV